MPSWNYELGIALSSNSTTSAILIVNIPPEPELNASFHCPYPSS